MLQQIRKKIADLFENWNGVLHTFLSIGRKTGSVDLVPINLKNGLVKRKTQHEFGTFRVIPTAMKYWPVNNYRVLQKRHPESFFTLRVYKKKFHSSQGIKSRCRFTSRHLLKL